MYLQDIFSNYNNNAKMYDFSGCCPACVPYYRNVQVFVPGAALVIGFIALLTLIPQNIGARSRAVDGMYHVYLCTQLCSLIHVYCWSHL